MPFNPKVLFIDDDRELLNYIAEEFGNTYSIFQAYDGKEGWNSIHEIHPDLIVCDIHMPEMDGWELCKSLKSDVDYSHIPIILLTIDSYLEKPINLGVLHTRMLIILRAREKSRMKFQKAIVIEPSEITTTSIDE